VGLADAGYKVTGLDIDEAKVRAIREGQSYILDVADHDIARLVAAEQLSATTDYDILMDMDVVLICVPTPFDAMKAPDLSAIVAAATGIAKRLQPGQLIILQSTTYPGTTEGKVLPILEQSGLRAGHDFHLAFSPERIKIIDRVIAKADIEFEKLYSDEEGQILIHGDLHYWNIHVFRGELYIMDFEDVMLGYPVQDIAITLYYGRGREEYASLREAFKRGYTRIRPWPIERTGQIEILIAARSVNFINYVALIEPSPGEYITEKCDELIQYLEVWE